MREGKTFPILGLGYRCTTERGFSLPWSLIEPHNTQAMINHGGQDLEGLAERGGLSPLEALAVLTERRWKDVLHISTFEACVEIGKILARWEKEQHAT